MQEAWEELLNFEDEASAQALAELLTREGVPALVEVEEPLPGLVENVRVVVRSDMAPRARWILSSSKLTDEELEIAATGKLPAEPDGPCTSMSKSIPFFGRYHLLGTLVGALIGSLIGVSMIGVPAGLIVGVIVGALAGELLGLAVGYRRARPKS